MEYYDVENNTWVIDLTDISEAQETYYRNYIWYMQLWDNNQNLWELYESETNEENKKMMYTIWQCNANYLSVLADKVKRLSDLVMNELCKN